MAQLNITLPEELLDEVRQFGNSSLLVRRLLAKEINEASKLNSIISKSQLTEEDVEELSKKIEEKLTESFEKSIDKD